jgi:hypothetical protein
MPSWRRSQRNSRSSRPAASRRRHEDRAVRPSWKTCGAARRRRRAAPPAEAHVRAVALDPAHEPGRGGCLGARLGSGSESFSGTRLAEAPQPSAGPRAVRARRHLGAPVDPAGPAGAEHELARELRASCTAASRAARRSDSSPSGTACLSAARAAPEPGEEHSSLSPRTCSCSALRLRAIPYASSRPDAAPAPRWRQRRRCHRIEGCESRRPSPSVATALEVMRPRRRSRRDARAGTRPRPCAARRRPCTARG